jgi:hypothetical protein
VEKPETPESRAKTVNGADPGDAELSSKVAVPPEIIRKSTVADDGLVVPIKPDVAVELKLLLLAELLFTLTTLPSRSMYARPEPLEVRAAMNTRADPVATLEA